jgi:hypothetical protein
MSTKERLKQIEKSVKEYEIGIGYGLVISSLLAVGLIFILPIESLSLRMVLAGICFPGLIQLSRTIVRVITQQRLYAKYNFDVDAANHDINLYVKNFMAEVKQAQLMGTKQQLIIIKPNSKVIGKFKDVDILDGFFFFYMNDKPGTVYRAEYDGVVDLQQYPDFMLEEGTMLFSPGIIYRYSKVYSTTPNC